MIYLNIFLLVAQIMFRYVFVHKRTYSQSLQRRLLNRILNFNSILCFII